MTNKKKGGAAAYKQPPLPPAALWTRATAIRTREKIRKAIVKAGIPYGIYDGQPISIEQAYLEAAVQQDPTLRMDRKMWKVVQSL